MDNTNLHISKEEFESIDITKKFDRKDIGDVSLIDKINNWMISKSSVKMKTLVSFFRLLATMINSGLPIVKSLSILEAQEKDVKMKKVCSDLKFAVEMGQSLSGAMEDFPEIFSSAQMGMIRSGEISGKLNQVLIELADQIESAAKIRGKIKGAMTYPITIFVVLCIVIIAVSVLVIPGMKETFAKAGSELPAATKALVALSDFFKNKTFGIPNYINFVLGMVGFVFGIKRWKKTKSGAYYFSQFIFLLPIFGNLVRKMVLTKFCRGLTALLKSGISINKALNIVADIVDNEVYRRRIKLIAEDVASGITISENIKGQEKMWPTILTSMIEVGEKTAQIDNICEKVASFYEDEVENITKNLSALMEPIIILIIGGVVGWMVVAIMTPIMSLSEVTT